MKIGNAFSLNMVQLPATIVCSMISVEQIKEMMADSKTKALARVLVGGGIQTYVDDSNDDAIYVDYRGCSTTIRAKWGFDENVTQRALEAIALPSSKEAFDAIVMIANNASIDVASLESVIGHADTARIVSNILGVELPANRANVKLQPGDKMIVAQYSGPRLPEGATILPEGAKIEFVLVEVN